MQLKRIMFSIVACLSFSAAAAQGPTYTVEPGQRVEDVLKQADYFLYPQFEPGQVHFKDGYVSRAKLNYSFGDVAIEFIGNKGDTMVLANEDKIAFVVIDTDTFYYHKTFMKQLARFGDTRVLLREYLMIADQSRVGGYGANETGAMDQTTRFNANNAVRELVVSSRLTIVRQQDVFVAVPGEDEPVIASRKVFEKRLPAHLRRPFANYLKANKVNFGRLRDLEQLLKALSAN